VPDDVLLLARRFSLAGEITVCTKSARMLRVDFKNNDRLSTLSANAPLLPNRQASSVDLKKTFCMDGMQLIV
jgi:hypothetical protein